MVRDFFSDSFFRIFALGQVSILCAPPVWQEEPTTFFLLDLAGFQATIYALKEGRNVAVVLFIGGGGNAKSSRQGDRRRRI